MSLLCRCRNRIEAKESTMPVLEQLQSPGKKVEKKVFMLISLLRIFKTLRIHFYRLKYSVHISRKHPAFLILLKLPSLHVRIVYGMTTWMYYIQSGKKPESKELRSNIGLQTVNYHTLKQISRGHSSCGIYRCGPAYQQIFFRYLYPCNPESSGR